MIPGAAGLAELEAGPRAQGQSPRALLLAAGEPAPFTHVPDGDLYDRISRSQAYFHRHQADDCGHIHLFLRRGAIPATMTPLAGPADAPTHLGALELGGDGWPVAVFATNRWVTGEAVYAAADLERLLPVFSLVLPAPWVWMGRWLTAAVAAWGDRLIQLAHLRDAALGRGVDPDDQTHEILARLALE